MSFQYCFSLLLQYSLSSDYTLVFAAYSACFTLLLSPGLSKFLDALFIEPFGPQLPSKLCLCQNPAMLHLMFAAVEDEKERKYSEESGVEHEWYCAIFACSSLIDTYAFTCGIP